MIWWFLVGCVLLLVFGPLFWHTMPDRPLTEEDRLDWLDNLHRAAGAVVHCWKPGETEDGRPATCMSPHGHDGPHLMVPDEDVIVEFSPKKT